MKNPILVTGSHRSGTTWVGKMLNASGKVLYIQEPFNIGINGPCWIPDAFEYWFYHIPPDTNNSYLNILKEIMNFNYPFSKNILRIHNLGNCKRFVKNTALSIYGKYKKKIPLIKDPIAIFSAEWLAINFNMKVIVMIRHPAAFASSLKRLNWQFDFTNWLKQETLMKNYLKDFRKEIFEIIKQERDIIDQSILLWNGIYSVVDYYRNLHKDWLFIRQEDLAKDPLSGFKKVYQYCNLPWSKKVEDVIKLYSSHNNVEEVPNNVSNIIQRDSKATIKSWKNRLTQEEIRRIYHGTNEISKLFYSSNEL